MTRTNPSTHADNASVPSTADSSTADSNTADSGSRRLPSWVNTLVQATESRFRLPFTSYRFGYDALLGLIPGIGDLVGMALGMAVVFAAHQVDASKKVIARMLGNLALDAALGAVPVVGDLFDFAFRANRRNLKILQDELNRHGAAA